MIRFVAIAAIGLCGVAGMAFAQPENGETWSAEPGGDELVVIPPPGWKPVRQSRTAELYELMYVPGDQSENDWTESMNAQIFVDLARNRPMLSPVDFVENILRFYRRSCEGAGGSPASSFEDRGYPAAVRLVSCPRQKGQELGSFSMVKVIRGAVSVFVLNRTWRGPAFQPDMSPVAQEAIDEWAEFLDRAWLCNRREASKPCPAPTEPTGR